MEIVLSSPNFYIHLHDAVVIVQFLIDGFVELAANFEIKTYITVESNLHSWLFVQIV